MSRKVRNWTLEYIESKPKEGMLQLTGKYEVMTNSSNDKSYAKVDALCDCGKLIKIRLSHFQSGNYLSCGCEKKHKSTYLLYNPITGLTKIGNTINIITRKKQIEAQAGMEFILEYLVKEDLETMLHRRFKDLRIIGEWFNLSEDDIKFIKGIK